MKIAKKQSKKDGKTSVDFAVEAAKKAAESAKSKNANTKTDIHKDQKENRIFPNESAAHTVDFAVAAAKKSSITEKEEAVVVIQTQRRLCGHIYNVQNKAKRFSQSKE